MRLRWPHIHRDPDWQAQGANGYSECKCGARRVRRLYRNIASPVAVGWPSLSDRHGVARNDSGWVMPDTAGDD